MAMNVRWRVNVLCLVGAMIGVASIFLTWVKLRVFIWGAELNLIDLLNEAIDSTGPNGTQVLVAGVLMIIGSLIAFLSPAGGLIQLIGIPLFLEWFMSESESGLPSGAGVYVAVASAIVVIASAVKPIGLGYGSERLTIKDRLMTFGRLPLAGGPASEGPENAR